MPVSVLSRPYMQTGGNCGSPKIDLSSCVFLAQLWREELKGSPFLSSGVYGIPSHPCTVTGATWGSQGRTFDGTDDYISIADNDALDITGTLWIEIWLKTYAYESGAGILTKSGAAGADPSFFINQYDATANRFDFRVYDVDAGASRYNTADTPLNTFFMLDLVSTQNANNQGYINGVASGAQDGAARADKALRVNTDVLKLGWSGAAGVGAYSNCTIGEIRIYNRAPRSGEILQNFNATKWRY